MFFASLLRAWILRWFFVDLSMDFYHFQWIVDEFTIRAPTLENLQKRRPLQDFCFCLHFRITSSFFSDFPYLWRYQFWHWFLMRVYIDFTSFLEALRRQLPCFWVLDFKTIFSYFFIAFQPKCSPNHNHRRLLFPIFFEPVPQGVSFEVSWLAFAPFWLRLESIWRKNPPFPHPKCR